MIFFRLRILISPTRFGISELENNRDAKKI